jgi:predicted RNA methylase
VGVLARWYSMKRQVRSYLQAGKRAFSGGRRPRTLLGGPGRGIRMCLDIEVQGQTWVGLYEIELNRHIRRLCRPGTRTVDVGGGLGYHALVFARLSGAEVATFEPNSRAIGILRSSLAMNPDLEPLVRVIEKPVGESGVRLDEWCANGGFDPGLLKIDVDGAELEVLESAREVISRSRPAIIIETHTLELERQCGKLLRELGYRVTIVNQRRVLKEHRPALANLAGGSHNRWLVAEVGPRPAGSMG